MFDGYIRTLDGVRYVPKLKRNFLSIGILYKFGCSIKFLGGEMKIIKGAMTIMRGVL